MHHITRILIFTVFSFVVGPGGFPTDPVTAGPQEGVDTAQDHVAMAHRHHHEGAVATSAAEAALSTAPLTAEQQELVDAARDRFAAAGIDLPEVPVLFPADDAACGSYGGIYRISTHTVTVCRPSMKTMVHELAHAWIETSFTDADRAAFLELRGLETWTGGDHWDHRGAEHAAEIITWGVMEEDISVPWIETLDDGTEQAGSRLFKIPDSSPEQLHAAYTALTGAEPVLRLADGAEEAVRSAVFSPEAG